MQQISTTEKMKSDNLGQILSKYFQINQLTVSSLVILGK